MVGMVREMPKRGALEYFVAVVQEGQMTSAARRLGIAQSALSQAIAQLETEVGVKLLARRDSDPGRREALREGAAGRLGER
jgi:DNA-binding transcriptional LysR family regulator